MLPPKELLTDLGIEPALGDFYYDAPVPEPPSGKGASSMGGANKPNTINFTPSMISESAFVEAVNTSSKPSGTSPRMSGRGPSSSRPNIPDATPVSDKSIKVENIE